VQGKEASCVFHLKAAGIPERIQLVHESGASKKLDDYIGYRYSFIIRAHVGQSWLFQESQI
jgi:hypothetical protein